MVYKTALRKWPRLMSPWLFLKLDVVNQRGGCCQDPPPSLQLWSTSCRNPGLAESCHKAQSYLLCHNMSASLLSCSFYSHKKNTTQKKTKCSSLEKNLREQSSDISTRILIPRFMTPIQKAVCMKELVSKYSIFTFNPSHLIFTKFLSFKMESVCYSFFFSFFISSRLTIFSKLDANGEGMFSEFWKVMLEWERVMLLFSTIIVGNNIM